jgi:hypothetical protein
VTDKLIGWEMHEEVGISINNPMSCTIVSKPDIWSTEEFLSILKAWSGNENIHLLPNGTMALNNKDAKNFKKFIRSKCV